MPDRRLDASALRDWAHTAVGDLITHTDEINRLNVFPRGRLGHRDEPALHHAICADRSGVGDRLGRCPRGDRRAG